MNSLDYLKYLIFKHFPNKNFLLYNITFSFKVVSEIKLFLFNLNNGNYFQLSLIILQNEMEYYDFEYIFENLKNAPVDDKIKSKWLVSRIQFPPKKNLYVMGHELKVTETYKGDIIVGNPTELKYNFLDSAELNDEPEFDLEIDQSIFICIQNMLDYAITFEKNRLEKLEAILFEERKRRYEREKAEWEEEDRLKREREEALLQE